MAREVLRPVISLPQHEIPRDWPTPDLSETPIVIRSTCGGKAALPAAFPGPVICPRSAVEAHGLLRAAIASRVPVLFLEHEAIRHDPRFGGVDPGPEHRLPLHRASIVQPGRDLSLASYGAMLAHARSALATLSSRLAVELIDLRTLAPFDHETLADSVRRTGKLLVVDDLAVPVDCTSAIAARGMEELFTDLDGPVRGLRLSASDPEGAADAIVQALESLAGW